MNISKIQPSRCLEGSVLHKEGILIPFRGIHLGEKKGGTAQENLDSS